MIDSERKIQVMGILNLDQESFFAPSRFNMSILESGADIVDIGAVSTRPGAAPVPEKEEWRRLEPVLRLIGPSIPLSLDTTRSTIVERACDMLGRPVIVNDISSGEDDPAMLQTVARLGLRYIAMHKRGTPATMQGMCQYDDVVGEVLDYFRRFAARASESGVTDWVVDPGFGFAKTAEQNFALLDSLERFCVTGRPLLVGISRKSFIYRTLGITAEESLPAVQALHMAALERGADILRVHDVDAAKNTVALYRMLSGLDVPDRIVKL